MAVAARVMHDNHALQAWLHNLLAHGHNRTVRSSAVVHVTRTAALREAARSIAVIGRTLTDPGRSFCMYLVLERAEAAVLESALS